MFARVSGWVDRWPLPVVVAWVAVAVGLTVTVPSLSSLGTADQTQFLPSSAPSRVADDLLRREFPDDPSLDPGVVVLARPGGLTPADRQYIATLARSFTSPRFARHVKAVQTAAEAPELAPVLRSGDGAAELMIVSLRASVFTESANRAVAAMRRHLDQTSPAGLEHHVTGLAALTSDQARATIESFDRTALATVAMVLLILVLVYRSVLAPLISLVSIGCAFLVGRGVASLLAQAGFKVASLAETFMVVMAFGAGTDYCLFVISRYREHRGEVGMTRSALRRASEAVGPVITASAATVTLGFLSFLAARLGLLRSFGPVLGLAIAITLLASVTLTPALLRLAGRTAFWPSRSRGPVDNRSPRWEALGRLVGRRPAAVLLIGTALLAVPAAATTQMKLSFDIPSELPTKADSREGFVTLSRHYPGGLLAPVYVVIASDDNLLDDERLAAVDRLTDALRREGAVAEVRSITQPAGEPLTVRNLARMTGGSTDLKALGIDPDQTDVTPLVNALASERGLRIDARTLEAYPALRQKLGFFLGDAGRTTRLVLALRGSPYARQSLEAVRALDDRVAAELAGSSLTGARLAVAGPTAFFADLEDLLDQDLRSVGSIVIGAVLVILALLLRSIVAPLYLLATVLLSLLAAIGICVGVFQGLLGQPGLAFWLPIFLFVMLVALGADYNIFIAGRIREELDHGRSIREATCEGLILTGPTITSAGFILAGTFAVLLLTPLPSVRQIGFGVSAGILLDTFIVRTLIVPAATIVLGRFAFWPSGRPSQANRRLVVGGSTIGVVALAISLVAFGLGGRPEAPVLEVAAGPASPGGRPLPPSTADGPDPVPEAPTAPTLPGPPPAVGNGNRAASDRQPEGLTPSARPRAAESAEPAAPGPASGAPGTSTSSSTSPPPAASSPPATTARPGPQAAVADRVVVPMQGAWRYHVQGARRVGLAGSSQPFEEDVTTNVSRTGGDDQSPELRLLTESGSGTVDEHRRYGNTAVDLLALRVQAFGITYGGAFSPPQLLIPWPARIGERWEQDWNSGDTQGHTTARVTGERSISVAGSTYRCIDVVRDTTLTGTVTGTQRQRSCWTPELGMVIDDDQDFQGTYQGVRFDAQARFTLLAPP